MTNKLTLTEQEELFAKDCKLINLKYEYNGYTGDERWAIITELSVKELWEKYPLVIERYSPFVHLSIAQGEVIDDANRNEDKYAKRSSRTLDCYGYDDEMSSQFHKELAIMFDDPFERAEEERLELEREELRQCEIRKARIAGNELYIIPEVTIPGGHVDFFLVSAKNKKVKDFVGIELQTMDTTGTVWPERQRLLDEHGIYVPKDDINNKKPFGMNWKMTAKTILVQMHHKAQTFENLNKHLVLIIQKPLYEYMRKEFSFSHIQGVRVGDAVHFHSYDVVEEDNGLHLALDTRVSTDTNGVAECLGLNAEANVELEDIIALLESKLLDEYRLTLIV